MLEGIAGVVIGLMVGATAIWLWMDKKVGDPDSVETLKRENQIFRDQVNEHFVQTAELINQLTDSYKAVFDHLSEGAEKLVDEKAVRERMPQVSAEEIRLKRLGAPREEVDVAAEESSVAEEETRAEEPEVAADQEDASRKSEESDSTQPEEAAATQPEETGTAQDETDKRREESSQPRP